MRKTVLVFVITLCAIVFSSSPVSAQSTADSSALILYTHTAPVETVNYAAKKRAIRAVLQRYGSPMADSVDSFISACRTYELDCYLLPSIAGLESTFGQYTWEGSYNAFGWGGGYIMFRDWDEGIMTVGKGLRENYINASGSADVYQMGYIYSESPTWAVRVERLMSQFEQEEEKNTLFFSKSIVEL